MEGVVWKYSCDWWYSCVSIAAVLVRLLMVHLCVYCSSTGQVIDGHLCVYYRSTGQTIDGTAMCLLQQYWSDCWWSICVSIAAVLVRLLMVHLCVYCSSTGQTVGGTAVCLLQQYWSDC